MKKFLFVLLLVTTLFYSGTIFAETPNLHHNCDIYFKESSKSLVIFYKVDNVVARIIPVDKYYVIPSFGINGTTIKVSFFNKERPSYKSSEWYELPVQRIELLKKHIEKMNSYGGVQQ